MQEPENNPPSSPPMFREPVPGRRFPATAVIAAAVLVAMVVTAVVLAGRRHAGDASAKTLQRTASYAPNLVFSNLQMSESSSMSGGKQTYIEGRLTNRGPATVTGITVQAVFANDAAMAPQIETEPLNIIYMREPYVDTRPVSASPLAPGGEKDFRLIFEDVGSNWNQQMPQIHVTQVATK